MTDGGMMKPLIVELSIISHIPLHAALERVIRFLDGYVDHTNFDITVRNKGDIRTITVELIAATKGEKHA